MFVRGFGVECCNDSSIFDAAGCVQEVYTWFRDFPVQFDGWSIVVEGIEEC